MGLVAVKESLSMSWYEPRCEKREREEEGRQVYINAPKTWVRVAGGPQPRESRDKLISRNFPIRRSEGFFQLVAGPGMAQQACSNHEARTFKPTSERKLLDCFRN